MSKIRTSSEIIRSYLEFYRVAQPLLDTKPGTVARDLLIDGPSDQLSKLYDELNKVSSLQSLRQSFGSDLDNWAQNIGAARNRGARATVPALLLFDSIDADIAISKGDLLFAKNGTSFAVINSVSVTSLQENQYKATVSRYKSDLDFLGITEQYALELVVEATAFGDQGNISKYGITRTNIVGITSVTNVFPAGGGRPAETDSVFKNRVLSIFSGSNTGTSLGYSSTIRTDPSVLDVLVIPPGDDLMTRDGTQVSVAEDGTRTIISEGTGGKVDIITYGIRLQENVDSFIYKDKSNTGDPTNSLNDYVLGQITGDENKTVTRKRIDNLASSTLPAQPINNVVSVIGSSSGPNFKEKTTDIFGRVSGNYELVRDTGGYANSPWGFDRLHWISNKISDVPEDKTKNNFNTQDQLFYTDSTEIKKVTQNIIVTNENSKVVASDRSLIQLLHSPATLVTRVFNVSTGERYLISSQNPDGSGTINYTGRIKISGKSLPSTTDILQVDYTWIFDYDPYWDFDNKIYSFNSRNVSDSIDWGYSNLVRRERGVLTSSGSYLSFNVTHSVSSVLNVNVFSEENTNVVLISGKLSVVVSSAISNVVSIKRDSDGAELWNTKDNNGSISALVAYLPSDTVAQFNDSVTVVYNASDVYADTGSFNNNQITIIPSALAVSGSIVECTYIANIFNILPGTLLSSLPAIRNSNYFNTNISSLVGNQPVSNLFSGSSVIQNLRQAPSNLMFNITGTIVPGVFTITGDTISYAADILFTASNDGLTHDLSPAIRSFLKLTSKDSLSSSLKVARLVKFEKVITDSSSNVLSVSNEYDVLGVSLKYNSLVKEEAVQDLSLSNFQIKLPNTSNNLSNNISIGDKIRIRFYLVTSSDSENVYFTKAGSQYTQKKFVYVDTIAISSGFNSSASSASTLTITNMNQPIAKSRYKSYYDFVAPKVNERITVTSNYNKLISDATLLIESTRPITADVLVKAAEPILADVTMYIVVTEEFKNSSLVVKQNVQDAVAAALNSNQLNQIVDSSDLINSAYTIAGVDRARVIYFNKTGSNGSVLSIKALKNQYIVANDVSIVIEER
jgi:hypothetical protein